MHLILQERCYAGELQDWEESKLSHSRKSSGLVQEML